MEVDNMRKKYYFGTKKEFREQDSPKIFYAANPDEFVENLWKHSHFSWLCDNPEAMKLRLRKSHPSKKGFSLDNKKFMDWICTHHLAVRLGGHNESPNQ
jgi:hypothetical protein